MTRRSVTPADGAVCPTGTLSTNHKEKICPFSLSFLCVGPASYGDNFSVCAPNTVPYANYLSRKLEDKPRSYLR